jgi:hypothetical protein
LENRRAREWDIDRQGKDRKSSERMHEPKKEFKNIKLKVTEKGENAGWKLQWPKEGEGK